MYESALKTWNDIGKQSVSPNENLGNHYFPGLPSLAAHYLETGDVARFADLVRKTEPSIPLAASVPATGWEALTELVADKYNRSQTINDLLDQRPDLVPQPLRSPARRNSGQPSRRAVPVRQWRCEDSCMSQNELRALML